MSSWNKKKQNDDENEEKASTSSAKSQRIEKLTQENELDELYGYQEPEEPGVSTGWLVNMHAGDTINEDGQLVSCVHYYFIKQDGDRFKVRLTYQPYFYIEPRLGLEHEIANYVSRRFEKMVNVKVELVAKEDLDLNNHLSGLKRNFVKLTFDHVDDMQIVLKPIRMAVSRNKKLAENKASDLVMALDGDQDAVSADMMDEIVDMREYDVPFHVRVSIDKQIFVAHWYDVNWTGQHEIPTFKRRDDLLSRPDPVVLAYDIETTKLPLKFPNSEIDHIMMISYMVDGQGYLIINRAIISADVEDFEFTPRPEFEGPFIVFNEEDELATIRKFFDHIQELKPHVIVTYNGDFFDWPFVDDRAKIHGLSMKREIGFERETHGGEDTFLCRQCLHMDTFKWVKRDSYLPVGSQGLKAAAKAKLRFDPVELDPELMCKMACEQPQVLATYSVSDALATYFLYQKYVHPFIFALCMIIPMEPDEVLRKGSGTLCESLLMDYAYKANVIYPNKQQTNMDKTFEGHLLESETYVGGRVEAIECGVFRADFPEKFRLDPDAYQALLDAVDETMKFSLEKEEGVPLDQVEDYDEVCAQIKAKLESLRDTPNRIENPLIYHLDVGAMYPNIILTNRLQPPAIINENTCVTCDWNTPDADCRRRMDWMWRGEFYPATKSETSRIKQQLETEKFTTKHFGNEKNNVPFFKLPKRDQDAKVRQRLAEYSRRAYKKVKTTKEELRNDIICQRENAFYINTVRMFRDKRYEYKGLLKKSKKALEAAQQNGADATEIKDMNGKVVLYDSLQLAHKCILNSFYGYVMRKGSRWFSMEMAGIVCYTGANIIKNARMIVEKIGRGLELDTDGIWCILPATFPENFTFKTRKEGKKKVTISYPGSILNYMCDQKFTNEQYHDLDEATGKYTKRDENSIFFEVDGPYKAMILPASTEQGRKLKKRYAVFNFDGSLAELKGFEVKRRGELQLVKLFQMSVFDSFLKGKTLKECYGEVAKVADYWIDVLYSKAAHMPDEELFDLIAEKRNMSKKLSEYGEQKSTSITTAKRLAEFLGDEMVKDSGLACNFFVSKYPAGAPTTERTIPLAIFQAENSIKNYYVRKWCKDSTLHDTDIRDLIDWAYYLERFGATIQKIITIPAALQNISNPVPRIKHPDWLHKELLQRNDPFRQGKMMDHFKVTKRTTTEEINEKENKAPDIENLCGEKPQARKPLVNFSRKRAREDESLFIGKNWKDALGEMPVWGETWEERRKWFKFQKLKWEFQRKKRRILKKSGKVDRSGRQGESVGGTLGAIKKRAKTVLDQFWSIIQVDELQNGEFKLWTQIGHELHHMTVSVPRIFYVNRKTPKAKEIGPVWRRVQKSLPRSTPADFLYQYSINESDFKNHYHEIQTELNGPDVEGVYEMGVPLDFRLMVDLGCVCSVTRNAAKGISKMGVEQFKLDELESHGCSEHMYLSENIRTMYVHHNGKGNTQFLALYSSGKLYIYLLAPSRQNLLPNITSLYKKYLETQEINSETVHISSIEEVKVETSSKELQKSFTRAIAKERLGPTIFCVQSPFDELPVKIEDAPIIRLPSLPKDELAGRVDWQKAVAESFVSRLFVHKMEIENLKEQARFYHIPIGNIPNDCLLYGADLFYARALQRSNQLLWCSMSARPDLGGRERDLARLEAEPSELVPLFDKPGLSQSITVEMTINGMFEAALLQSHNLTELDGFETFQQGTVDKQFKAEGQLNTNYAESTLALPQYRILKNLVAVWVKDIAQYDSSFADAQVQHLMRYITSTTSLLFDPAIQELLVSAVYRLYKLLCNELKRIGCEAIHVSPRKLILVTKKKNIAEAIGYVDFIEKTLRKKELFQAIDFKFTAAWETLLWHNQNNYGGIQVQNSIIREIMGMEDEDDDVEEDEEEDEMVMKFEWAEHLPTEAGMRASFTQLIAGYIKVLHEQAKKDSDADRLGEFAVGIMTGEFSDHLLEATQKILNRYPAGTKRAKEIFPKLAGSYLTLDHPALFYAKIITQVLSAHAAVSEELQSLRRNVFRLLGISEFSEKGQWVDPAAKLILKDVVCTQCGVSQDLDLSVDLNPDCECEFFDEKSHKQIIEARLIEELKKKVIGWNLQDVVCMRCNQVRQGDMGHLCECAGRFKCIENGKDLQTYFRTIRQLAAFYKMSHLSSTMDWILGSGARKSASVKIDRDIILN